MPRVGDFIIDLRVGGGCGIVTRISNRSLNYGKVEAQLPVAFGSVYVVPIISFFTRLYWKLTIKVN